MEVTKSELSAFSNEQLVSTCRLYNLPVSFLDNFGRELNRTFCINQIYEYFRTPDETSSRFSITSADFTGRIYVNTLLVGLVPMEGFNIYTNDGSGVLLKVDDGYTFDATTGAITTEPGNYFIQIY